MARWYGSFDNSTVSALEAATSGARRQRRAFTTGTTLRNNLIAARDALSAAMYGQLTAGNRRGDTGIVLPRDGITRGGGVLSFSNIYTNVAAIWPADPSARPASDILVAGSTAVTPADSGSIADSLYTDASAAVEAVLTQLNVRTARTVNDQTRMLRSIFHDHALTYIAWDDYTPGLPSLTYTNPANQSAATDLILALRWSPQYPMDLEGTARVTAAVSRNGGGAGTTLPLTSITASGGVYNWTIPGGTLSAGTYTLDFAVTFRDPNGLFISDGQTASYTNANAFTLT